VSFSDKNDFLDLLRKKASDCLSRISLSGKIKNIKMTGTGNNFSNGSPIVPTVRVYYKLSDVRQFKMSSVLYNTVIFSSDRSARVEIWKCPQMYCNGTKEYNANASQWKCRARVKISTAAALPVAIAKCRVYCTSDQRVSKSESVVQFCIAAGLLYQSQLGRFESTVGVTVVGWALQHKYLRRSGAGFWHCPLNQAWV
jgi:hypothetical protein